MAYTKQKVKQALWLAGVGNMAFYKFDGVGFTNDGTPVLFTATPQKVPMKVRKACAGKRIKIMELNMTTDWAVMY